MLSDKRILVTGGTGSFGKKFVFSGQDRSFSRTPGVTLTLKTSASEWLSMAQHLDLLCFIGVE